MAAFYTSQAGQTTRSTFSLADCHADFHPDQFYKPWSSTESEQDCHRGSGAAGIYGAETTDCDSPFTLVNATFQWINDNLKDTIDFVVWTGDSARHDADERLPRTEKQVLDLNEMLVNKFTEVFGKDDNINDTDPTNDFIIPIVPNFGNNDIMPHNIMTPGPNFWTKRFLHVWRSMIPEEQRHGFERGGWFFVEVIPNQLAVFSLNTLYFFDNNAAVDGCAKKSEPGFEHMEWLRIQLQFLRKRGMKAILMGHVPPARTDGKQSWDETCWQKYTLWMRQYRDVVVGSVYGHMNIDHFMLQDFEQIKKKTAHGRSSAIKEDNRKSLGEKISIQSSADYLTDLREDWARIPNEPKSMHSSNWLGQFYNLIDVVRKKKHESKKDKYLQEIGGEWAERYSATLVSASVVPNYFPSMRVIEYNITGVDHRQAPEGPIYAGEEDEYQAHGGDDEAHDSASTSRKKHKKKKKHHKKQKFTIPSPPSKSSPPGPAYSPQPFTWTSYTQYYANLTRINNDFHDLVSAPPMPPQQLPDGENTDGDVETEKKVSHNVFQSPFTLSLSVTKAPNQCSEFPDPRYATFPPDSHKPRLLPPPSPSKSPTDRLPPSRKANGVPASITTRNRPNTTPPPCHSPTKLNTAPKTTASSRSPT